MRTTVSNHMQALHVMQGRCGPGKMRTTVRPRPTPEEKMGRSPKRKNGAEPLISVGMAQALSNPWRFRIVMELSSRPMSVAQFVREVGGEQSNISRRFKQLSEWGFLELLEEKSGGSRRGGVERIYRSTLNARLDASAWRPLPLPVRDDISRNILDGLMRQIEAAFDAGTFDQEVDRHLSWKSGMLDQPALLRLGERLDEVLDLVPELEDEARGRIDREETEGMSVTVGLLAFRSPPTVEESGTE